MYTNEQEIEAFKWQFIRDAFYNESELLIPQANVKVNNDLALFRINSWDYSFDWWRLWVGYEFIGKMIFHNTGNTEPDKTYYLFEVLPVIADSKEIALIGKGIRAKCLELIRIVNEVPVTIP